MNVYVGNLSPQTSLSTLRGSFEIFGTVANATISTYIINGIPRSLGVIEMPSRANGQAAIAGMQGKELSGNLLKVHEG